MSSVCNHDFVENYQKIDCLLWKIKEASEFIAKNVSRFLIAWESKTLEELSKHYHEISNLHYIVTQTFNTYIGKSINYTL